MLSLGTKEITGVAQINGGVWAKNLKMENPNFIVY